jgi:hypothetical protein
MKTFHCTHCRNLVFFENTRCLNCGRLLAYLPDRGVMAALNVGTDGYWHVEGRAAIRQPYRLCANYVGQNSCNWAIPIDDSDSLCQSCRLTRVIPDLTPVGKEAWVRLEAAKRRLLQSLLSLELPVTKKDAHNPGGVIFEFLKDSIQPNGDRKRVLTGHDNGLITINIAEADDVERERQRQQQQEPYRTLLGHFRHEIGHYYWDLLIRDNERLLAFRELFGDERADYAQALKRHYQQGAPTDWEQSFISSYATSHPWEDWAETWAHFLHMTDALETAGAAGLSLKPLRVDEPVIPALPVSTTLLDAGFDNMIERWLPLTYVMNNLSRGLGLADNYPFVLSAPVIRKLRFIYDTINERRPPTSSVGAPTKARALRTVGRAALLAAGVVALVGIVWFVQDSRDQRAV